jgi:hypothetical protein
MFEFSVILNKHGLDTIGYPVSKTDGVYLLSLIFNVANKIVLKIIFVLTKSEN